MGRHRRRRGRPGDTVGPFERGQTSRGRCPLTLEEQPMVRASKWWWLALVALTLVLVLTATAVAAETRGRVKAVSPEKNQLIVADNADKNWTFLLDEDAKVIINSKDAKLADLQPGDEVFVIHQRQGEREMAVEVRCKR